MTDIRKNDALRVNPKTGEQMHVIQAHHKMISQEWRREWVPLEGFQLRYIYFLDPKERENLTVPTIPFSEIAKRGAKMYKGKNISAESIGSDAPDSPVGGGRCNSDLGAQGGGGSEDLDAADEMILKSPTKPQPKPQPKVQTKSASAAPRKKVIRRPKA